MLHYWLKWFYENIIHLLSFFYEYFKENYGILTLNAIFSARDFCDMWLAAAVISQNILIQYLWNFEKLFLVSMACAYAKNLYLTQFYEKLQQKISTPAWPKKWKKVKNIHNFFSNNYMAYKV